MVMIGGLAISLNLTTFAYFLVDCRELLMAQDLRPAINGAKEDWWWCFTVKTTKRRFPVFFMKRYTSCSTCFFL